MAQVSRSEADQSGLRERAPLSEVSGNIIPSSKSSISAKAGKQGMLPSAPSHINLNATHLISSPYPDLVNQLRLGDLETPYQLFAFALTAMRPIRDDYATAPYLEAFNWSEVFSLLQQLCSNAGFVWEERSFYTVVFRSKLQPNIDRDRLGLLDQKSHEEACQSGGLLKYWFGSPNGERRNLATCLWRHHKDAVAGGSGPWHKQARQAAQTMYEKIDFQVYKFVVEIGAKSWRLEEQPNPCPVHKRK